MGEFVGIVVVGERVGTAEGDMVGDEVLGESVGGGIVGLVEGVLVVGAVVVALRSIW